MYAFAAAPSCTPSRAAILTGRHPHELEAGANLWGFLPAKFDTYSRILEQAGYHVGLTGKGWGPGDFRRGGYEQNPAGKSYKDFASFYKEKPGDRPFCFWFGSSHPHRPYNEGSGIAAGLKVEEVKVPSWLPDVPVVRKDILDYYQEVEQFDSQFGEIMAVLREMGELDNTFIIITGDNGMPFPRAKATLYDAGTRVPLIMALKGEINPGVNTSDLVSLADIAPTILEAAGLPISPEMTGESLWPMLRHADTGHREMVFTGRERHANVREPELGYPGRAVRTRDYLYIRNYEPDRWPAGDPQLYHSVGPYGDVDGSPAKEYILDNQHRPDVAPFFAWAFAKRPAEELYDLRSDPHQLNNVASQPQYKETLRYLGQELARWQERTRDPRLHNSHYVSFDRYPYFGPPVKGARSQYKP